MGVRIASVKSKKASLWLSGRKNIFNDLRNWRKTIGAGDKLVWIHCASLGEFEQGRPLIEKIKNDYPVYKILVSFFSPSGYEIRKNYSGADGVFYLPMDGKRNAFKFTEIVKPTLVIWVKYEYWYYYLAVLKQENIPVVLVSAIFRKNQPFFKGYGRLWRRMLECFTQIFVQNEHSAALLDTIKIKNAAVAGDTRFDRVTDNAEKLLSLPDKIVKFCKNYPVIVAGSTWEEDEEVIVHYAKIHPHIKFIIAPHEIEKERLDEIKKLFGDAVLYSEFSGEDEDARIMVIDNVGMLSGLYALADVTYIGGGFNESGIHNISEAAVFGKPIIFGPQYGKFREAVDLVDIGGAFSVETALELEAIINKLLNDHQLLKAAGEICKNYVFENRGASDIIMKYLQANRLLIN